MGLPQRLFHTSLSFKMVGNKFQRIWSSVYCHFTHRLGLKMIRDMSQRAWPCACCLITHLFGLEVIRDTFQQPWFFLNFHFTCLLSFKTIRDKFQPVGHVFSVMYQNTFLNKSIILFNPLGWVRVWQWLQHTNGMPGDSSFYVHKIF